MARTLLSVSVSSLSRVNLTLTNSPSAHQMGSNQMGSKPTTSVVDPRARVWGCDCLYIADASIFPTASGVNPLLTVCYQCAFNECQHAHEYVSAEPLTVAFCRSIHRRRSPKCRRSARPGSPVEGYSSLEPTRCSSSFWNLSIPIFKCPGNMLESKTLLERL